MAWEVTVWGMIGTERRTHCKELSVTVSRRQALRASTILFNHAITMRHIYTCIYINKQRHAPHERERGEERGGENGGVG